MSYPDWAGALVYYLKNHPDMLDPVGGGAVTVSPKRPSQGAPERPQPYVTIGQEPGFSHDSVPIAEPRAGIFTYHTSDKNARDLMAVVLGILDPWKHGGNAITVTMPASLGSDVVRFNNFRMASTPIPLPPDEGWPLFYCPLTVNIHTVVLS